MNNSLSPSPAAAGWRRARLLVALLLMQLHSACGPGVGGTGTGDSVLAAFGANAAPVCASTLATRLACPDAPPVGSNMATPPTALVYFADGLGAAQVLARIEDNRIDLDAPCLRIRFSGEWGTVPGQAERFYGSLTTAAAERPVLATLSVQTAGNGVVVMLQDEDGRVRFGPRLLLPVSAPPAPGPCS